MFRIQTTPQAELTGKAAELFAMFPPQLGVPEPLLLLAGSPGLLAVKAAAVEYSRSHPDLGFEMLAAIRHLAAKQLSAPACVDFNAKLLRAAGLDDAEIATLPEAGGAFTEAERALLGFVLRALRQPGSVTDADIAEQRGHGWKDATILDALAHAADMQVPALLMRALKR
ncbi:MAG: hypothetical protein A2051_12250 [Desulfovibrionales bacterium GWA2_65_9]|nr:MAG: hypothetical protein A2051_12250 [Desulfovibrionales bacterium GWA2_65_9]